MKEIITEEFKFFVGKVYPIAVIFVFLPLISYLIWLLSPAKEMEILIIDKTVPSDSYQEHRSIFWALDYLKFQNGNGELYDEGRDYFGFFPDKTPSFGTARDLRQLSEIEIVEKAASLDLIYFADTYGVYEDDFKEMDSEERSKKIYGGLNRGDINLLREAAAQNKTIVAEFNTMASPTSVGFRTDFENLMGLKWTGWIARYFDEIGYPSGDRGLRGTAW